MLGALSMGSGQRPTLVSRCVGVAGTPSPPFWPSPAPALEPTPLFSVGSTLNTPHPEHLSESGNWG